MRLDKGDGNGSRTRNDLMDNQVPFPEGLTTETFSSVTDRNRTDMNLVHSEIPETSAGRPQSGISESHTVHAWSQTTPLTPSYTRNFLNSAEDRNRTCVCLIQSQVQRPAVAASE